MRLLYDDGLKNMIAPSLEEIAEKELRNSPPQIQKLLLEIRKINKRNKEFYKEKNKLLITKQHLRFVKCGQ